METKTLEIIQNSCRVLDEKKGEEIVCLDLTPVHSYLEYFVIVTGNSRIHCRSLAQAVADECRDLGLEKRHVPADDSGWIVLDYCDIVFHIFLKEKRDFYNLERLWSDAGRVEIEIPDAVYEN